MYGLNKAFRYHECQRHVRLKSHKLQTQLMISVFMMNETVSLHGIRVHGSCNVEVQDSFRN